MEPQFEHIDEIEGIKVLRKSRNGRYPNYSVTTVTLLLKQEGAKIKKNKK
jgi:hypothetical protein